MEQGMSREVRRVPLDWQHPMTWVERWDRVEGRSRMRLVPRALHESYPDALAYWEQEGEELSRREGFDWTFWSEYCLTGYKGRDDSEPVIHPYGEEDDKQVPVRDADHLHELLMANHDRQRPDPSDYMPEFVEGTAVGWCMYETTSEGTPISPVFETPEALAHWLADTGASAFGGSTATYEQWLSTARAGWAPSAVATGGSLQSGVEFVAAVGAPQ
jgi:hypothetical protein